jgi:hypothetical protein
VLWRLAETGRNDFHGRGPMLVHGFAECEGLGLERFQPNVPPGGGIVFVEDANFHSPS